MDAPKLHCDLCCDQILVNRDPVTKEMYLAGVALKEAVHGKPPCQRMFLYTTLAEDAKHCRSHICDHCLRALFGLFQVLSNDPAFKLSDELPPACIFRPQNLGDQQVVNK